MKEITERLANDPMSSMGCGPAVLGRARLGEPQCVERNPRVRFVESLMQSMRLRFTNLCSGRMMENF